MTEEIIFRRRNRLKKHFVNVSNVLLYGYKALSDAAKITYQVIEGFDWEDKETGDSKGFVFPSIQTIAEIRDAGIRTIFRHLQELEKVGLLTRVRRRNKPSVLYIEEVSDVEANSYLARYVDKTIGKESVEYSLKPRNAKNGSSHTHAEMPKMAVAYRKKEDELKKENEINVNENFNRTEDKKRSGLVGLNDILKRFDIVKSTGMKTRMTGVSYTKSSDRAQRDYYAQEIADTLQDQKSLGCFRVIAEKIPSGVIFETLASIKETWREGKIKQSRGALFVDIMKTYAQSRDIKLGFS